MISFLSMYIYCIYIYIHCGPSGTSVPVPVVRRVFHAGLFVGVSQKSILNRACQVLAINAHEMAPRTRRWLQERGRDTPT